MRSDYHVNEIRIQIYIGPLYVLTFIQTERERRTITTWPIWLKVVSRGEAHVCLWASFGANQALEQLFRAILVVE